MNGGRTLASKPSRLWAALALFGLSGCALSLTAPDPKRPRNRAPECDTGKGMVAVDGLYASAFGIAALATASEEEAGAALALTLMGALFVASAVRGNTAVNECRVALDEFARDNAAVQALDQLDRAPTVYTRNPGPPGSPPVPPPVSSAPPRAPTAVAPAVVAAPVAPPPTSPPRVDKPSVDDSKPAPAPPTEVMSPWDEFWREVR
ncbi:MAG: hypothetical protein AB7O24_12850 [Kofleriaceae bacterium]